MLSPQLLRSSRGQTSVISYVLVLGLVIAAAGATAVVLDSVDNPIEGQQGTSFAVDRTPTDRYRLVYVGEETLDSTNTDVLELSNGATTVLTTPDDWSNQSIEQGDVIDDDLTANFSHGDEINIIQHSEASIQGGKLVSQSGGKRLQSVIIRQTDPKEIEDVPDDIFVDDPTDADSNITVVVE